MWRVPAGKIQCSRGPRIGCRKPSKSTKEFRRFPIPAAGGLIAAYLNKLQPLISYGPGSASLLGIVMLLVGTEHHDGGTLRFSSFKTVWQESPADHYVLAMD